MNAIPRRAGANDAPSVMLDVIAALLPSGGIGRYVHDLADALATRADAPSSVFAFPSGMSDARVPDGWGAHPLARLPWGSRAHRALTVLSARAGLAADRMCGFPAAVHLPAGYGLCFDRAPMLVTVHDHTALTHPEWHPFRLHVLVRASTPVLLRRARRVVCDSEYVRRQTIGMFGLDPNRVETMHLPVGPAFRPVPRDEAGAHVLERFGLSGPFVLHVGTFEPRKNHVGLAKAFDRLCGAGYAGQLVMVGRNGWRTEPIHAGLAACRERERHRIIPEATDRDLAALYSACDLLVFPSLDEGFGFPPLEAMACGAAVVVADRASLPEVVGDAGVLVDPDSKDDLAEALVSLWRDPARREELGARGVRRAALFDRETWIARIFAIYRELLDSAR